MFFFWNFYLFSLKKKKKKPTQLKLRFYTYFLFKNLIILYTKKESFLQTCYTSSSRSDWSGWVLSQKWSFRTDIIFYSIFCTYKTGNNLEVSLQIPRPSPPKFSLYFYLAIPRWKQKLSQISPPNCGQGNISQSAVEHLVKSGSGISHEME